MKGKNNTDNSEDKEEFEEITLTEDGGPEQTNGESDPRSDGKNEGENRRKRSVTIREDKNREQQEPKREIGLHRSKTVSNHRSASPAHIPKRKLSQKVRTQQQIPPNCTICYGNYTQPKQLPCLHTFCQNCLEKFVNPKLMVECPTCREVILQLALV